MVKEERKQESHWSDHCTVRCFMSVCISLCTWVDVQCSFRVGLLVCLIVLVVNMGGCREITHNPVLMFPQPQSGPHPMLHLSVSHNNPMKYLPLLPLFYR